RIGLAASPKNSSLIVSAISHHRRPYSTLVTGSVTLSDKPIWAIRGATSIPRTRTLSSASSTKPGAILWRSMLSPYCKIDQTLMHLMSLFAMHDELTFRNGWPRGGGGQGGYTG